MLRAKYSFAQQGGMNASFVVKNTTGTFNLCDCDDLEHTGYIANQSPNTIAKGAALSITNGTFNFYSGGIINCKTVAYP